MADSMGRGLDYDAVATLKHLALLGALDGEAKLSSTDLGERLDASAQTASRRLNGLEEAGHVEREIVGDGQWVSITESGERRLRSEYDAYQRIFESPPAVELVGRVTSGMGEGRHYITLSGYMRQFRERLGYEPFPGTLNVDLDAESVRERTRLEGVEPVEIEGWEDDERTYGPAYCYPATVTAADGDSAAGDPDGEAPRDDGEPAPAAGATGTVEEAHVIAPERTHHGEDQLEVIAPVKLRDALGLSDDSEVIVRVTE